jgi:hypothetical protein
LIVNLTNIERIKFKGFLDTFEYYPVNSDWRDELYNYFIKGFRPGSFHTALLSNNLIGAVHSSHVSNQWSDIQAFVKWVQANAPDQAHGNTENVGTWLLMTAAQRQEILIDNNLMCSDQELAWKLVGAEEV